MKRTIALAVCALVGFVWTGCAANVARLYRLDTAAPPLELKYKDGRAWVGEQSSPTCQGEYKTSTAGLWGGRGSAILVCQNGRVLECNFEFSEWTGQGTGACLDNENQHYRMLF